MLTPVLKLQLLAQSVRFCLIVGLTYDKLQSYSLDAMTANSFSLRVYAGSVILFILQLRCIFVGQAFINN